MGIKGGGSLDILEYQPLQGLSDGGCQCDGVVVVEFGGWFLGG